MNPLPYLINTVLKTVCLPIVFSFCMSVCVSVSFSFFPSLTVCLSFFFLCLFLFLSVSLLHTFVPVMMSNNNSITSCTLTVGYFLTFVLEPHRHQKWQHPAFNQSTSECHTTSCAQNGHFANRVWQLPYLTCIVYLNTSVHSVFVLDSNVHNHSTV